MWRADGDHWQHWTVAVRGDRELYRSALRTPVYVRSDGPGEVVGSQRARRRLQRVERQAEQWVTERPESTGARVKSALID